MELSMLKGIGPTRLENLRAAGICSLRDLLYRLPVRYEDMTAVTPCSACKPGMTVLVQCQVRETPKLNRFGGMTRVTAALWDESGKLPAVWYNQPWICQQLTVGEEILLYGRVGDKNGRRVLQNPQKVTEQCILPVYRAVKGIPAKSYREMMKRALEEVDDCCPETLPREVRLQHHLCETNFAIRQAHFPDSMEDLKLARRRFAFEQMLMYQAAIGLVGNRHQPGFPMAIADDAADAFWKSLPFAPTGAQRKALQDIAEDLRQPTAMSRLVQGDVGCGKTAIAFGAIALACGCGYQTAMMAPTEILARQHYESAVAMLEPLGIACGLLTGTLKASEKRKAHEALATGKWQAVFGTHALISEKVTYHNLGLVITDEQHRFGVQQRSILQDKGNAQEKAPHVLVMSATPIPRTLALILYGDLDITVVDELPPGRQPVKTRIVPEEKRSSMYAFLRGEIGKGHQAYVVCPLVEDSETMDNVRSAKATYQALMEEELNGLRVGLTWGDQRPEEKDNVLHQFAGGELDVLVSTTVIEVGVNVPNATVMVIENAERFGLSQLHQLRGRVGRGSAESWCFLLAGATERLRIMTQTNDGFLVAQKDLELRGPGDLMGTRQSGESMADFLLDGDVQLLEEACQCMKQLRDDPSLLQARQQVEQEAAKHYTQKIALN